MNVLQPRVHNINSPICLTKDLTEDLLEFYEKFYEFYEKCYEIYQIKNEFILNLILMQWLNKPVYFVYLLIPVSYLPLDKIKFDHNESIC